MKYAVEKIQCKLGSVVEIENGKIIKVLNYDVVENNYATFHRLTCLVEYKK